MARPPDDAWDDADLDLDLDDGSDMDDAALAPYDEPEPFDSPFENPSGWTYSSHRAAIADEETRLLIIPGRGTSRGSSIVALPRRQRPFTMRLFVLTLSSLIIVSGLYAIVPLSTSIGAPAQDESAFQALSGAVVWHASEGYTLYTVKSGDTVEGVAARFGVQIGGIYELNHMLSGQDLQLGKTYKIPTDPSYGLYYRPPSFIIAGNGTTTYTDSPWTSMAGIPPEGSLCGPAPQGQGDNMANYNLLSFKLYGPNPNSYWVRGFIPNFHFGVDISQPAGVPIHAAQAGEVIFSGWDPGGGGWTVKINNCNHLATMYCHMQAPPIAKVHQMVQAGDVLGYEGMTGDATGPHLHFQVEWDNVPVDPLLFYASSGIGVITRCGAAPSC
jgi:LysM repeat protein